MILENSLNPVADSRRRSFVNEKETAEEIYQWNTFPFLSLLWSQ